jgi:hypothetical protein
MASRLDQNGAETQDVESQQDAQQDPEQQPLLSSTAAEPKKVLKALKADPPESLQQKDVGKGHSRSNSLSKQDSGQCRICLEEDCLSNLEAPCGCTGTQRYAHRECIQKWVNEKHNATCEICDQPYKGSYIVPPPDPQQEVGEQLLQMIGPLPNGTLYLTVEDDRAGGLLSDVYDNWDDHRQPTVSWCFSVVMFLLFLMFLHTTVSVSIPDDSSSSSSGGGGPGSPSSMDPSGGPGGSGSLPSGTAAGFAAGVSLFLMWALTKLFMIMLPLLMVMRIAARAQEQAAESATATAVGSVPGLDGSPAAAGAAGNHADGPSHYQSMVARILGSTGSSNGMVSSSSPAGSRSSLTDLEMEVLAARRAASGRLGRDPTFFAPSVAATATGLEATGQQQQQEEVAAAEQRMMAAVRSMIRAALMNASAQRERSRLVGSEETAVASEAPARLSGVV